MFQHIRKLYILVSLAMCTVPLIDAATFSSSRGNRCAFVEQVQLTLGSVNAFYQNFPIASAFLTCGVKASAADYLAQMNTASDFSSRSNTEIATITDANTALQTHIIPSFQFELPRNMAFLLYGAFYQGVFQYYLYNQWFPEWFGRSTDLKTVAAQVGFDSAVIVPLLCLPIAYLTKGLISHKSIGESMKKYFHDMRHTNLMMHFCVIWIPTKFLAFGVVPEHLRIAFFAFVSFFWMIILSTIASSSESEKVKQN